MSTAALESTFYVTVVTKVTCHTKKLHLHTVQYTIANRLITYLRTYACTACLPMRAQQPVKALALRTVINIILSLVNILLYCKSVCMKHYIMILLYLCTYVCTYVRMCVHFYCGSACSCMYVLCMETLSAFQLACM